MGTSRRIFRAVTVGAALAVVLFAVLPALSQPTGPSGPASDAAAEATLRPGDAGVLPLDALRERVDLLETKRRALRVINDGSLPEALYTTELFSVDLRDEEAVAHRIEELTRDLARPVTELRGVDPFADGGTVDGGVLDDAGARELAGALEILERDVARLRVDFLKKPVATRAALLDAESDARKQARDGDEALSAERKAEEQRKSAEAAQRAALDEAERAQEAGLRAVANERARAAGVRANLAARRGALSKQKAALAKSSAARGKRAFELQEDARTVARESPAADALYDAIVEEVQAARDELSGALDERRAPVPAPRFEPDPQINRPDLAEARRVLEGLATELGALADVLEEDERALSWDRAADAAERAKELNATRLTLLSGVSAEKRARTLGFGEEGREQFRREVTHLTLLTRWTWISQVPALKRWLSSLKSPVVLATLLLRIFGILLLVGAARFVARRGPVWTEAIAPVLKRMIRRPYLARTVVSVIKILGTLWGGLTLLGTLLLVPSVLGDAAQNPFLLLPYAVLLDYAVYRLAIRAAHRGIGWFLRTPMGALAERLSDRVLRSLHLVGRFAFGLHIFVTLSAAILGRGYLHALALRFGWLGAVPVGAVLISSWRGDIVQAYLTKRPSGSLADAVRRTSTRWYGFFVAALAFIVVLVGWIALAARRFVLSFDQTRKALAYLFRRRLEREAGERPPRESVELPPEVAACLRRTPVTAESFLIERFPELDRWEAELARWLERDDLSGAWLIVGKTGFGKTSWLNAAEHRAKVPVTRLTLTAQVETTEELMQILAKATLAESLPAGASLEDLATALNEGPDRIVMVDELQNLMLRSVGHMDVWVAFNTLVEQSARKVFWVCACAHFTYEFLKWARRSKDAFREVIELEAWSESEIRDLLEARTKASGWTVAYDDLVTARPEEEDQREHLVSTAQEYTRLIWGYSEGAPRVAVQCWADSLVPGENKTLKVRLFARPPERHLEVLEEAQKFVLAAVVWHENVSVHDAARSLRYPPAVCQGTLYKLVEIGVLVRAADDRYRVTTEWWPSVIRYLARKHLIEP